MRNALNPLNELSDIYLGSINEEDNSPEAIKARVMQHVRAIRYRARKEGENLNKAYNEFMGGQSGISSTEKQMVKERLGLTGGSAHVGEGYQRDPEQSKKDRTHSSQPDPSKDGFTGIGNMSIKDIMKMNAKMKKEKKQKLGEEGYDRMRDDRLVKYGIGHDGSDKSGPSPRPTGKQPKGDTVYQAKMRKKYGGKLPSAIQVVKDKYKGQIYDGKKKG